MSVKFVKKSARYFLHAFCDQTESVLKNAQTMIITNVYLSSLTYRNIIILAGTLTLKRQPTMVITNVFGVTLNVTQHIFSEFLTMYNL